MWYQKFLLQRVPTKPIWGQDWEERVRRGVPGIGGGAAFAWMPMVIYAIIPAAAVFYMFATLCQQIVLDYRDDRVRLLLVPRPAGRGVKLLVCCASVHCSRRRRGVNRR